MDPALLLGLWGAVLSTILALLRLLEYYGQQRPRITVSATQGFLVAPEAPQFDVILLEAVNTGRRPVTITEAYLVLKNGTKFAPASASALSEKTIPCLLKEGEIIRTYFDAQRVRDEERETGSQVVRLQFRDAHGRHYTKRFRVGPPMPGE
jgi:hypothetical protein